MEYNYSINDLTVDFDASSSYDADGKISSYEWDFGDGTNGSGIYPIHPYTKVGNYTVELTVTDDEGKTNSISQTIALGSSSTTEENNDNGEDDGTNEDTFTPGFEFILILYSVVVILFYKQRR